MSVNRRIWIDTDTASDDAVAIVMALKHPTTEVVGDRKSTRLNSSH